MKQLLLCLCILVSITLSAQDYYTIHSVTKASPDTSLKWQLSSPMDLTQFTLFVSKQSLTICRDTSVLVIYTIKEVNKLQSSNKSRHYGYKVVDRLGDQLVAKLVLSRKQNSHVLYIMDPYQIFIYTLSKRKGIWTIEH